MISIDGFVLAGGSSSRMGSDKSMLLLGGRTLVERAANTLTYLSANVFIVGNVDGRLVSRKVFTDVVSTTARGSIVGLYSALHYSRAEWTAVLACDLPFVTPELLSYLNEQISSETDNDFGAMLPAQPDGRLQPLCGFYRTQHCINTIKEMLDQGKWRLQGIAEALNARVVQFAEIAHLPASGHFFDNLNTEDDYLAAIATENMLAGRND